MNLSIITVVRNAEHTIRDTIESVLNQTSHEYEYIVVDGLSSDRTYGIVCSYDEIFRKNGIQYIHISEKDNGIYDAMNKSVTIASGTFVIFMNAGDVFSDNSVIEDVEKYIKDNQNVTAIYGDVIELLDTGSVVTKAKDINHITKKIPFCHQACFTNRVILLENPYDCSFKIAADYELYLRLYMRKNAFLRIDRIICRYRTDGVSRTQAFKTYCENVRIKEMYGLINKRNLKQKILNMYYKNLFIKKMPFHHLAVLIQKHRK